MPEFSPLAHSDQMGVHVRLQHHSGSGTRGARGIEIKQRVEGRIDGGKTRIQGQGTGVGPLLSGRNTQNEIRSDAFALSLGVGELMEIGQRPQIERQFFLSERTVARLWRFEVGTVGEYALDRPLLGVVVAREAVAVLDSFGRPDPNQDPPCERSSETSVVQALHLMNSPKLNAKVTGEGGRAAQLAAGKKTPPEIVDELYLLVYSRLPKAEERDVCVRIFDGISRRQATEDILWALLNTPEFVFKD